MFLSGKTDSLILTVLFLCISPFYLPAQTDDPFLTTFVGETGLRKENLNRIYVHYDFSRIWNCTDNQYIVGIIGDDNERIRIKFLGIEKDSTISTIYHVKGKSRVKDNICPFEGQIVIDEIREAERLPRDLVKASKGRKIKSRGIVIANYLFREKNTQEHSGIFRGRFYSKWYVDSANNIRYDDLNISNERYSNNAFIGIWEMYDNDLVEKCNWADYRIPVATEDLDIGNDRFMPAKKYFENGWESYIKAFAEQNQEALKSEFYHWWK